MEVTKTQLNLYMKDSFGLFFDNWIYFRISPGREYFSQTLLTFLHFLQVSFSVESFVWFSCDRIVRREVAQIDWISLTFFALLQTQVSDKASKLFTF